MTSNPPATHVQRPALRAATWSAVLADLAKYGSPLHDLLADALQHAPPEPPMPPDGSNRYLDDPHFKTAVADVVAEELVRAARLARDPNAPVPSRNLRRMRPVHQCPHCLASATVAYPRADDFELEPPGPGQRSCGRCGRAFDAFEEVAA